MATVDPAMAPQFQPGAQPVMLQSGFPMQAPMQVPMQGAPMQTMQMPMGMQSGVGMPGQLPQPQVLADNWGGQMPMAVPGFSTITQPNFQPSMSDIQDLQQLEETDTSSHMKYCACEACQAKKSGSLTKFKSSLDESPQKSAVKAAPTNLSCQSVYCVEVRDAKTKLDGAELEVKSAESTLDAFSQTLEALKREALKAERKAENTMDTVSELKDKHKQIGDVMKAGEQARVDLERDIARAQDDAKNAFEDASNSATKVQVASKELPVYKNSLMKAKAAASSAYSEWTVAVCKASAACSGCTWFEELEGSLSGKCAYACSKCDFKADIYDIDKHEAVCSGDKSKIFHCSFGCGFRGEFDVCEKHEQTTCPLRGRAPIAVGPRTATGPPVPVGQGMYTSQTLPPGFAMQPQQLYTSSPNIQLGGAPMQTMAAPAAPRKEI